ncbi:hypothetical protein Tco_0382128 [Tanacetum coccineum]
MLPFDKKDYAKASHARAMVVSPIVNNDRYVSQSIKAISYVNVAKASFNNDGKASKTDQEESGVNKSLITLSQDSPIDFPLAILGCYKDLCSIANTQTVGATLTRIFFIF